MKKNYRHQLSISSKSRRLLILIQNSKEPIKRLVLSASLYGLFCTAAWGHDKKIEALCAQESQIGSVQFDRFIYGNDYSHPTGTFTPSGQSIYQEVANHVATFRRKGDFRRVDVVPGQHEEDQRPVPHIETPQAIYQYDPLKGQWQYTDNSGFYQKCEWLPSEKGEYMRVRSEKVLGREMVDGKPCLKIELRGDQAPGSAFANTVWVWEAKGLEIKSEDVVYPKGTPPMKTRFKNINFSFADIPDSAFEVPKAKLYNEDQRPR